MSNITQGLKDFNAYLQQAKLEAKPHQQEAVKWALEREHDASPPGGVHGGLLADEMGLGKTIQVLALLVRRQRVLEEAGIAKRPSLVIVPKSLIFNLFEKILF